MIVFYFDPVRIHVVARHGFLNNAPENENSLRTPDWLISFRSGSTTRAFLNSVDLNYKNSKAGAGA